MNNLLNAELYQLSTRKSPKIWLLASVLLSLFVVFVYYAQFWVNFGVRPDFQSLPVEPLISLGYVPIVQATAIFFLIGLGNTAFHDETKNRTFINTISVGHSRAAIYIAKYISGLILGLSFLLISVLTVIIAGMILFSGDLSVYLNLILNDLIWQNLPIWLMYLALFQIIYTFSASNLMMNVLIILLIALPLILQLLTFSFDFIAVIEPYVFTQLSVSSPIIYNNINLTPWIALLYFALFIIIGISLFKRKEIK